MTGKGHLTQTPNRRLKAMLGVQIFWLIFVCVLGAWWGSLILKYAAKITDLEKQAGLAPGLAESQWTRTQHMLYWEGGTFFILLLASTVLLFWLYWRDVKRSRSIQAFFAALTHELRTPLTSIRLQAEALAEDQKGEKEGKEEKMLQRLLEDTLRLESQVERTLELARIEGGGPVYSQPLRLKPWIERTIQSWRETHSEQTDIELKIEDLTARADSTAVQIILKNLLENSLKHSRCDKIRITLSAQRNSKGIWLQYQDNGGGIEQDIIPLGKLFHKGPRSTGAGVGLYLIRVLMERMGGQAEFHAKPGFPVSLCFQEERVDA